MATRTMSTVWRSVSRRARSCGITWKASRLNRISLSGSWSHSRKLTTAVCTSICTPARCAASRSAKNGNRSCIDPTASVDSRPENCLTRRSSVSGKGSRVCRFGDRAPVGRYTSFAAEPSVTRRGRGGLRSIIELSSLRISCPTGGELLRGGYIVDPVPGRRFGGLGRIEFAHPCQSRQRGDGDGFGVHVEHPARGRAGIGEPEPVGPEGGEIARHPFADLVRYRPHPVRG